MDELELESRMKNAIILLADGYPLKVGDLTFGCKDKRHFSVTGWSIANDLKTITKTSAVKELDEIKKLFDKMTISSKALSDFIENRNIEYRLDFDYGMGALTICSENDGVINWNTKVNE